MSTAAAARVAPVPVPPSSTPPTSGQPATNALVPAAPASITPIPRGLRPDLDPLGDEIALLCAHITAATYRLLCLLRVYEEEERWQGFRSCAHWLSWRTGISLGPAREKMRVARCLPSKGSSVPAETSSRLGCDAEVVPIARGADGSVLDVGRRRRTVGWRLRKALEARDGGCRFPGCDLRARTHAHHITPWAEGGETAMNNLVLLCPFHHRAVHEGGWRVEMDECGTPRFLNPLRTPVPVVPASPDLRGLVPRDAARARPMSSRASPASTTQDFGLGRWHGQDGIDAWTGDSLWTGERIDWGYAMLCLWGDGREVWRA